MSNFSFLQAEWEFIYESAHRAEAAIYSDPRTSCFYACRSLELAVTWLAIVTPEHVVDVTHILFVRHARDFNLKVLCRIQCPARFAQ